MVGSRCCNGQEIRTPYSLYGKSTEPADAKNTHQINKTFTFSRTHEAK